MVSAFRSSVLPRGQAPLHPLLQVWFFPLCFVCLLLFSYSICYWEDRADFLRLWVLCSSRHFLSLDGGSPDHPTLPYAPFLLLSEIPCSTLQMTDSFLVVCHPSLLIAATQLPRLCLQVTRRLRLFSSVILTKLYIWQNIIRVLYHLPNKSTP